MSIYLDQIEKRKRLEEATLIETFEKATKRLGIWNDYLVCRSLLNESTSVTINEESANVTDAAGKYVRIEREWFR